MNPGRPLPRYASRVVAAGERGQLGGRILRSALSVALFFFACGRRSLSAGASGRQINVRIFAAALLVLSGCSAREIVVPLDNGQELTLPASQWRALVNESGYARNFEAVENPPPREYHVLTVFLNPMSEDRRTGKKISDTEYIEIFASNPGEITVLLRRDHRTFWLLSREMFHDNSVPGVDLSRVGSFGPNDEHLIRAALQDRIDITRHFLGSLQPH